MKTYLSVGAALTEKQNPAAAKVANAVQWLISKQNPDGTWGDSYKELDKFITTSHTTMALLSIGVPSDSDLLSNAFAYLKRLTHNEIITFFWRAGVFLNIPGYSNLINSDMEWIWKNIKRGVGNHPDYPVPFFLLKLFRFSHEAPAVSFSQSDVLDWILNEWDDDICWYDRSSITSMALSLIYDLDFKNRDNIVAKAKNYLMKRFNRKAGIATFSGHILEDSYLVFNLCENDYILSSGNDDLSLLVAEVVDSILLQSVESTYWTGKAPFGGETEIGQSIYPTAVIIRAIISYFRLGKDNFINEIGSLMAVNNLKPLAVKDNRPIYKPFWQELLPSLDEIKEGILKTDDICFVLMPFNNDGLNDVYTEYIKPAIENKTKLTCVRADDIYSSTCIMADICTNIKKAKVILAELTLRSPNVFYELGMAHALGKYCIIYSQSIEDVPFDLRSVRTIIYGPNVRDFKKVSNMVVKFINNSLDNSELT